MDELKFHLSQRIDLLQIWLLELWERGVDGVASLEDGLAGWWASEGVARLRLESSDLFDRILLNINSASKFVEPSFYLSKITDALGQDFNRATLYAGCIGFTIGSGIGIALGVCLQSPQTPITLMRSIVGNYKGVDSISLYEDAVVPKLKFPHEVLIEVKCSTIDNLDIKISNGYCRTLRDILSKHNGTMTTYSTANPSEVVLGRSGSGVVAEIGTKVDHLEVGDQVFFLSPPWCQGTLSEYIALPQGFVAKKPTRLGFEAAASLPYSSLLAWHYVVNVAKIDVRNAYTKRVLIHSGGSGCGWVLTQLCSNLGCQTVASGLNRTAGLLKTLGASHVLTLEAGDLDDQYRLERYNVVFNTVGPIAHEFCQSALEPGGLYVETFPPHFPSDNFSFFLRSLYTFWLKINRKMFGEYMIEEFTNANVGLNEVAKLVDRGRIQPVVEKVFSPEEVEKALKHIQSPHSIGETLIKFSGPSSNYSSKPDLLGS